MPTVNTTLWDTAPFGITAGTEFILFQVPQGGDSTHVESFTNMRGAGALPLEEKFVIQSIALFPDYAIPKADVLAWFRGTFLEIRVSDQVLFKALVPVVAGYGGFGGADTTTAAANAQVIGLLGFGFTLEPNLTIPGGKPFRVRIVQGTALTAAGSNIRVNLIGLLTFGGQA